jgi:uncharacterized membrane protein YgdD (TMEM256/DUF423 family)
MSFSLRASAGLLGFTGVLAAAYGSHALPARLKLADKDEYYRRLRAWDAATTQQLVHSAAILYAAYANRPVAGWLFVAGSVGFCSTVYLITLDREQWKPRMSRIAPFSGLLLMAGWLALIL